MASLYSVFDTNLYRGLSPERFSLLTNLEANQGVTAFASIWPCLELLAHCADEGDPGYTRARAGLRRLWQHAGYESEGVARLRVFEDGEAQLARGLFGGILAHRWKEYGAIAERVGFVATHEPTDYTATIKEGLKADSLRVSARETKFVEDLNSLVQAIKLAELQQSDLSKRREVRGDLREFISGSGGLLLIAETRVKETARQVGITLTARELESYSGVVLRAFRTAMFFLRDLVRDLIDSDLNMSLPRNRNSVWDLSLAFHASREASFDGVPVLLVSDDARLTRAAVGAGESRFVQTLAEYETVLKSAEVDAYSKSLARSSESVG